MAAGAGPPLPANARARPFHQTRSLAHATRSALSRPDITKKFLTDFTGKSWEDYEFGDITKKAIASFTGKDTYEFGDITKKIGQSLFGNKQPKKK